MTPFYLCYSSPGSGIDNQAFEDDDRSHFKKKKQKNEVLLAARKLPDYGEIRRASDKSEATMSHSEPNLRDGFTFSQVPEPIHAPVANLWQKLASQVSIEAHSKEEGEDLKPPMVRQATREAMFEKSSEGLDNMSTSNRTELIQRLESIVVTPEVTLTRASSIRDTPATPPEQSIIIHT